MGAGIIRGHRPPHRICCRAKQQSHRGDPFAASFGVIGGGVGFFSVKQTEGLQTIGISLTLLSALCLAGVIHGIHLRSRIPLRCFWATCVEPPTVPAVLDLPSEPIAQEKLLLLLSVKTRLQNADFAKEDKELVFKIAKEDDMKALGALEGRLKVIDAIEKKTRENKVALETTGFSGSGGRSTSPSISMPDTGASPAKR